MSNSQCMIGSCSSDSMCSMLKKTNNTSVSCHHVIVSKLITHQCYLQLLPFHLCVYAPDTAIQKNKTHTAVYIRPCIIYINIIFDLISPQGLHSFHSTFRKHLVMFRRTSFLASTENTRYIFFPVFVLRSFSPAASAPQHIGYKQLQCVAATRHVTHAISYLLPTV